MSDPFRLLLKGYCVQPLNVLMSNAERNSHYPRIQKRPPHKTKLAIVGGGPSLIEHMAELKAWDGDIWAINHTAEWLNQNGVSATLFSVDPCPMMMDVPAAILSTVCDHAIFAHLDGRVQCFDSIETHDDGFSGGVFSVTRAPAVSLYMGYTDVSFFGCDGSFEGSDHVDRHDARAEQVIIRAGGKDYRTYLDFMHQCEELSKLFVFDNVYHNRSGGLLKAICENPDTWEVVGVSAALKKNLERDGPSGLYDKPFIPLEAA